MSIEIEQNICRWTPKIQKSQKISLKRVKKIDQIQLLQFLLLTYLLFI